MTEKLTSTHARSERDRWFMEQGASLAAAMLRTLGSEPRLLVLCLLVEHQELTVSEMLEHIDIGQSALSQHLARMRAEGLVGYRREAQALHYRIIDPDVKRILSTLKAIYCP